MFLGLDCKTRSVGLFWFPWMVILASIRIQEHDGKGRRRIPVYTYIHLGGN